MSGPLKRNIPFAITKYSPDQLRGALKKMLLIRKFEEGAEDCYARGLIHGTMHLSIGQEASAVGICLPLTAGDQLTSTHRGHGHCLAKGAEIARMFAEFFGREDGYCKGRGGSMHIADVANGNLGANGIVAGIVAGCSVVRSYFSLIRCSTSFSRSPSAWSACRFPWRSSKSRRGMPVIPLACFHNSRFSGSVGTRI